MGEGNHRRNRVGGFSLIELLVVVAIVASLVSIVVPLFSDVMKKTMQTKVRHDLDVFVSAISRRRHGEGSLTGISLNPLMGRYLSDLPRDPWGNDYLFDGNLCVVGSFGGDGAPWGQGTDSDVCFQYMPYLTVSRAIYHGPIGVPTAKNSIELRMSKPYLIVTDPGITVDPADEIEVVKGFGDIAYLSDFGFQLDPVASSERHGRLVLRCVAPGVNATRRPISANDLVNLSPLMLSVTDFHAQGSAFESVADEYRYGPLPVESGSGVPMKK